MRPCVVGFTRARPSRRWVHSESLRSFGPALGVVVLVRVPWVHSLVPLRSSGSFGFIWARRGNRSVHSYALRVVVCFIGVCWIHSGSPWWSSSLFRFVRSFERALGVVWVRYVYSSASWGSLGSFWLALAEE